MSQICWYNVITNLRASSAGRSGGKIDCNTQQWIWVTSDCFCCYRNSSCINTSAPLKKFSEVRRGIQNDRISEDWRKKDHDDVSSKFQYHSLTQTIFEMTQFKTSFGTQDPFWLITGLPVSGLPSYKFGFRSSVQKNSAPGEGRHEGLVPRNDVLTDGFIRFSLARLHGPLHEYFLYLDSAPQKPRRRCEPEEALFAFFEAIRS